MRTFISCALLLLFCAAEAWSQDTAIGHFNAGVRKYRAGNLPGALQALDRAIGLNPIIGRPVPAAAW